MADVAIPTNAVKRRARSATTGVIPDAPTSGRGQNAAPSSASGANTTAPNVAPGLPSSSVWQNPYPTSYVPIPIASPPANPDLTAQDVAAQIGEYSDWDKYITGIGLTAANLSAQTAGNIHGIEQNLSQGLENNNWDTAARGLAQSSIRQGVAQNLAANASTQESSLITNLSNMESYLQGELNKWLGPGGLKESIDNKYLGIGANNRAARDAAAAAAAAAAAPPAPAPPAPAPAPAPNTVQTGAGIQDPFRPAPSTTQVVPQRGNHPGVYVDNFGSHRGVRYIIVNGVKKYESRAGAADWGRGGSGSVGP